MFCRIILQCCLGVLLLDLDVGIHSLNEPTWEKTYRKPVLTPNNSGVLQNSQKPIPGFHLFHKTKQFFRKKSNRVRSSKDPKNSWNPSDVQVLFSNAPMLCAANANCFWSLGSCMATPLSWRSGIWSQVWDTTHVSEHLFIGKETTSSFVHTFFWGMCIPAFSSGIKWSITHIYIYIHITWTMTGDNMVILNSTRLGCTSQYWLSAISSHMCWLEKSGHPRFFPRLQGWKLISWWENRHWTI